MSSGHEVLAALAAAVREHRAVALVTVFPSEDGSRGAKLLVAEDPARPPTGTTGAAERDTMLAARARECLRAGRNERLNADGADVFVQSFAPPPVLHVIGAVHPAAEVCAAGRLAGFRVVVCDPRSPFATAERLPAADEIVREWPDAHLASAGLGPRDAVAILTHDLKFDVPAIKVALAAGAGYVGAMGSRRTHERRVARLREEGVAEEQIARVASPIGLDLGARSPGEIAIAIVAEIVARRNRR